MEFPEYKKGIEGPASVAPLPEKAIAFGEMIKFAASVEFGVNDRDGDEVIV